MGAAVQQVRVYSWQQLPIQSVMATYTSYNPTSLIGRALFNFDAAGYANFRYTGLVKVSVSDAFTVWQGLVGGYSPSVVTEVAVPRWNAQQIGNIDALGAIYSSFIDLKFAPAVNYSGATAEAVGALSDVNISLVYRPGDAFAGESSVDSDASFGYAFARGDVVLNVDGLGGNGFLNDVSLDSTTYGFHALMHEWGHSLGLSHPHAAYVDGVATLTSDYAATVGLGFDALGFVLWGPQAMDKAYFSVMSYDDQSRLSAPDNYAQTPMILDVIALQQAYGEGTGTSSTGDDVIAPGGSGAVGYYRTYFDRSGTDTIDLVNYAAGAYVHMGAAIVGAQHAVGVSMGLADAQAMRAGGDPASLRWFYGDFENARGSTAGDEFVGNALNNAIDGGAGIDWVTYAAPRERYTVSHAAQDWMVESTMEGVDSLTNVERLVFSDTSLALDLDGAAGQVARVLGAVLGPAAVGNARYAGMGLQVMDSGWTYAQLVAGALGVSGKTGHSDVVSLLWNNLLGTVPTVEEAAPVVAMLAQGQVNQTELAMWVADTALNAVNIGLVGLEQTGLAFMYP